MSGAAPPPRDSRWGRMEDRVGRRAAKGGLDPAVISTILEAHRKAMSARSLGAHALPDEDHPAYLHPGRVFLILMDDLEVLDPPLLAIGLLAESRDLQLRVSEAEVQKALQSWEGAFELWSSLPKVEWFGETDPDTDAALLEELVLASPEVQRVAIAEALDHIRHAHLWESSQERKRAATLAREVFEPLAPRVHPTLSRRLAWWVRRVAGGL